MTLRIMLVGLVASLGFELPSDGDLSCWSHSGREWVAARLADFSGPRREADPPVAEGVGRAVAEAPALAEASHADADLIFEVASETMATDFAADLLALQSESPGPDDAPTPAEAPVIASVGLPAGEDLATPDAPAVEVVASSESVEADEASIEEEHDAPSVARLSNAVRLTREAVQAWAELIQESPEDAEPAH